MRLSATFERLKKANEAALILFVTAGDPSLDQLPSILEALVEGGADIIEVGIPFSDPIADGPVIQASSQRALDRGVTPSAILGTLSEARLPVPVVLMGYYNTILRLGLDKFAETAVESGAGGTIVCDMIPDEAGDWIRVSQAAGLDTIFLAAPTSTKARLDGVARESTGFVYAVARTGVTGAQVQLSPEAMHLVSELKERTGIPVCVGFGVRDASQVTAISQIADGVIVGSYLVDMLASEWQLGAGRQKVVDYVRSLKNATKRGQ